MMVKLQTIKVLARAAITKWHNLGGLTRELYFLTILEAKIQDQGTSRVGRAGFS